MVGACINTTTDNNNAGMFFISSNNVEFYLISLLLETEKIKRAPTPTMLCVLENSFLQRTTLPERLESRCHTCLLVKRPDTDSVFPFFAS